MGSEMCIRDSYQGSSLNLFGFDGAQVIEAGLGNDTLAGGKGNDTYVWSHGDGNDTITELGNGGQDTLDLRGVNPADVTVTAEAVAPESSSGLFSPIARLVITIAESSPGAGDGGQVTVEGRYFVGSGQDTTSVEWGIENIAFADGTVWDQAAIYQAAVDGLSLIHI